MTLELHGWWAWLWLPIFVFGLWAGILIMSWGFHVLSWILNNVAATLSGGHFKHTKLTEPQSERRGEDPWDGWAP